MNFEQYKVDFSKEASKVGYTEQNILRCLNYSEVLFRNNVPVIYNTSHLSALVGYNKSYLKRAVAHTQYFYRKFEIIKKNGTPRPISEPLPSLKEIQIWILENILYQVEVSPFAKAYKPKVRITENLKFHRKQNKVFSVDLEDFFSTITISSVKNIFRDLGYSEILSDLLSKLCCKSNCLPQGAPTSPCLSNIFFRKADDIISKYCLKRKIRYTRYSDDLTFSGDFNEKELLAEVTKIIQNIGLKINFKKTKLMTPNMRQLVTGVVVNNKSQVVFYKRNELRQALYYIKKYGLKDHIKFKNITQSSYLEHLLGKINFVLQINPEDMEFTEYKRVLIELKNSSKEAL